MRARHDEQNVAVLYGKMSLFLTLFHNIFLLYYVDMFLSVYKISSMAFFFGQIIFLLWNSINDPLFGWLTDRHLLNSASSNHDVIMRRLSILKFSGPLLAFSFGLFWVPWMPTSLLWLQFVVCLCLYDTFLTAVDLQHTSLLADISVHLEHRAQLNKYSSISSTIGCSSVFLSYAFWNKSSIFSFQVFCLSLSVFSAVGFYVSSSRLLKHYSTLHLRRVPSYSLSSKKHSLTSIWEVDSTDTKYSTTKEALQYFNELKTNHNFKCFFPVNLLQVFHCHFNSNFFPLFLQVLLSQQLSSGIGPLLIGLSFLLPHLNNVYFLKLCNIHGVYKVINILFSLKLIFALIMMMSGPNNLVFLCIFIASNRITTEGTCNLLNLVISDLVDEDYVINRRKSPASALMFGMTSLLAKPGQTIAPLLGTWLLSVVTGENLYGLKGDAAIHFESGEGGVHSNRKNGCFLLLTTLPLVVASLQLLFWRQFTLHGKNLKQIKERRIDLESRRTILSV